MNSQSTGRDTFDLPAFPGKSKKLVFSVFSEPLW
jgi:hypothetical protein